MNDAFNLDRFVNAQDPAYEHVLAELNRGHKTTHWIWFIFPQLKELGRSETAQHYGIGSLEEAKAYFAHPVLGSRLLECTKLVCRHKDKSIGDIMAYPDDLKLHSSMTLFLEATGNQAFGDALKTFYDGQPDDKTLQLLK